MSLFAEFGLLFPQAEINTEQHIIKHKIKIFFREDFIGLSPYVKIT